VADVNVGDDGPGNVPTLQTALVVIANVCGWTCTSQLHPEGATAPFVARLIDTGVPVMGTVTLCAAPSVVPVCRRDSIAIDVSEPIWLYVMAVTCISAYPPAAVRT